MDIEVLGFTKDLRSDTYVVYAKAFIDDYLELVGDNFDDFEIQRKREKYKAYHRMKKDIIAGALLPPITLAIKPKHVKKMIRIIEEDANFEKLENALCKSDQVNILDGLQRTYILKEIKSDGVVFKEKQSLLLEFWLEKEVKHLIYRLIVLNAGQKPMSMRHQVELLFATIKEKLEEEIDDLEIYVEKENGRRNRPGKYAFVRLVNAYQAFITKTTEIKKENVIAQQLAEESVLDSDEDSLDKDFYNFKEYLKIYVALDQEVFRIYSKESAISSGMNWLSDENVITSFFAALGDFGINENRIERIDQALQTLINKLREEDEEDPLGLIAFDKIRSGFNPKKENIGYSTRKLLMNGFKEFFREEGELSFDKCWIAGAD